MRTIAKLAIGAAMACGAAVAATAPAAAQVLIGGPPVMSSACFDAFGNFIPSAYCTGLYGYGPGFWGPGWAPAPSFFGLSLGGLGFGFVG
ncbi:MAG TPA: hypothetical protein VIX14_01465 [Terriglobales bacterium]